MKTSLRALCFVLLLPFFAKASPGDTVIFTPLGHYYYDTSNNYAAYTPLIDRLGRPYVYTASIDLGMITFDISNLMNPFPIDTLTPAELGGFQATNLAQRGDTLFVTTGGFQVSGNNAGLSTYDFTNPNNPVLLDHWDTSAFTHGVAHIVIDGDYAYLGAMDDGIIVLDISDVYNIRYVSNFVPATTPNTGYTPHSRGLYISGDTLLVADDGGGLRIIDATNKSSLVQIGAYLNPAPSANFGGLKPFYNHVWRIGDHAWIPLDYAGIEIDNVAVAGNVTNTAFSNIWNNTGVGSWFGSDGHTNEIVYEPNDHVLMVSGGDSQVLAVDPSSTSQVRIMGAWGDPNTDLLVAWGVDVYNGLVVSSYLRDVIQILQPYYSRYGGIQLLSYAVLTGTPEQDTPEVQSLQLFPNPANSTCSLVLPGQTGTNSTIELIDMTGRTVKTISSSISGSSARVEIDIADLAAGVYTVRVSSGDFVQCARLVKQ